MGHSIPPARFLPFAIPRRAVFRSPSNNNDSRFRRALSKTCLSPPREEIALVFPTVWILEMWILRSRRAQNTPGITLRIPALSR
jgi:hypothetical protein